MLAAEHWASETGTRWPGLYVEVWDRVKSPNQCHLKEAAVVGNFQEDCALVPACPEDVLLLRPLSQQGPHIIEEWSQ